MLGFVIRGKSQREKGCINLKNKKKRVKKINDQISLNGKLMSDRPEIHDMGPAHDTGCQILRGCD